MSIPPTLAPGGQRSDPGGMASTAILRPAPAPEPEPAVPAAAACTVSTPGQDSGAPPARRQGPWWRRLHWAGWRQPAGELEHAALERLLALLEEARAELWAGWVQDGWWSRPAADGRQILETGLAAGHSVPATAHATCLVGPLI